MPVSILLCSTVKGTAANKILKKSEKKLLEIRIRQCTFRIQKLEEEKKNLYELYSKIPEVDLPRFLAFTEWAYWKLFNENKTRQEKEIQFSAKSPIKQDKRKTKQDKRKKYNLVKKSPVFQITKRILMM